MAQCLVTFAVISPIEPSLPITVDGIMDPGLPPHTPYLGTPVVFPPGQRPVSFCFGGLVANGRKVWPLRPNFPSDLLPFARKFESYATLLILNVVC